MGAIMHGGEVELVLQEDLVRYAPVMPVLSITRLVLAMIGQRLVMEIAHLEPGVSVLLDDQP